ncbi:hypothetical protein [Actinopolymorpha alba]|uniref:hypothetical protein n=1 Tax=Actinopolymorpha alba TaxID=533267 RepID=UPI0012F6990E|nr:hypothetical protein [Actinopolymorpha alba]
MPYDNADAVAMLDALLRLIEPLGGLLHEKNMKDLETLRKLANAPGNGANLIAAAEAWEQQISTGPSLTEKLGDFKRTVSSAAERVGSHWSGDSANSFDQYVTKSLLPAFDDVSDHFADVASILRLMGKSIDAFWQTMALASLAATASLGAEIIAARRAGPVAFGAVVALIGVIVVSLLSLLEAVLDVLSDCGDALRRLENLRPGGFKDGRWPRPQGVLNSEGAIDLDEWAPR